MKHSALGQISENDPVKILYNLWYKCTRMTGVSGSRDVWNRNFISVWFRFGY